MVILKMVRNRVMGNSKHMKVEPKKLWQAILVNFPTTKNMVMALISSVTKIENIRVGLSSINLMVKETYYMQMEMCMREILKTIKSMVLVNILLIRWKTTNNTRDNSEKINSMGKGLYCITTEIHILVNF